MCEVNLVKLQCVTVKLLTFIIQFIKKCVKQLFSKKYCSITAESMMCEENLVKVGVLE